VQQPSDFHNDRVSDPFLYQFPFSLSRADIHNFGPGCLRLADEHHQNSKNPQEILLWAEGKKKNHLRVGAWSA